MTVSRIADPTNPELIAPVSVPEAIFIVRQHVKKYEQLAEQLYYKSGQQALARAWGENAEILDILCLIAVHHTVNRGIWRQVGLREFADGRWAELLTGDGFLISRPYPPPFARERRISDAVPIDIAPDGYEAKPLALAKEVILAQFTGGDFGQVYLWPKTERRPWMKEESDDWYDYDWRFNF